MITPNLTEAARSATGLVTLPVSEVFHTMQGEGPAAGRAASFVRLMGCNLSCSWCDTPYTWDAARHDLRGETTHRSAPELAEELAEHPGIVVLTGGEPLLHQHRPAFARLLELLAEHGKPVHVETNGTLAPAAHLLAHADQVVVSPKLPNAGTHRGHQDPALHPRWSEVSYLGSVEFKVVVCDAADVARAVTLAHETGIPPRRTWVMPEGRTADELAQRWPTIAAEAARYGIGASHRLHVLAWGDERGR